MQGSCKDVGIFINTAVEDRGPGIAGGFKILICAVAEEKDLQMEGPGMHIRVKIGKIGVVHHRLVTGTPAQPRPDPFCEGCFPRADVTCHKNKMLCHDRRYYITPDVSEYNFENQETSHL